MSKNWYQRLNLVRYVQKGLQEFCLLGPPFTTFLHYVQFRGASGERKGFYELCPDWDPEDQSRVPNLTCPICRDFTDNKLPENLQMRGIPRYYFNAFDITGINESDDGGLVTIWLNNSQLSEFGDLIIANGPMYYQNNGKDYCSVVRTVNPNNNNIRDRVRLSRGRVCKLIEEDGTTTIKLGSQSAFSIKWRLPLEKLVPNFKEIIRPRYVGEIEDTLRNLGCYAALKAATGKFPEGVVTEESLAAMIKVSDAGIRTPVATMADTLGFSMDDLIAGLRDAEADSPDLGKVVLLNSPEISRETDEDDDPWVSGLLRPKRKKAKPKKQAKKQQAEKSLEPLSDAKRRAAFIILPEDK